MSDALSAPSQFEEKEKTTAHYHSEGMKPSAPNSVVPTEPLQHALHGAAQAKGHAVGAHTSDIDFQCEVACDSVKVSAIELAGLVAGRVSQHMQILFEEQLLESLEKRITCVIKDQLAKRVASAQGTCPHDQCQLCEHRCMALHGETGGSTGGTEPMLAVPKECRTPHTLLQKLECYVPASPEVGSTEAGTQDSSKEEAQDEDEWKPHDSSKSKSTKSDSPLPISSASCSSLQSPQPAASRRASCNSSLSLAIPAIPATSTSSTDLQCPQLAPRRLSCNSSLSLASSPCKHPARSASYCVGHWTSEQVGDHMQDRLLASLMPSRRSQVHSQKKPSLLSSASWGLQSSPSEVSFASPPQSDVFLHTHSAPASTTYGRGARGGGVQFAMSAFERGISGQSNSDGLDFACMQSARDITTQNVMSQLNFHEAHSELAIVTEPLSRISLLCLRISGLIPWTNMWSQADLPIWLRPGAWYQWLVLVLAALGLACCVHGFTKEHQDNSSELYSRALLSDIPLTLGVCLGLIMMGTLTNSRELVESFQLLYSYAISEEFEDKWTRLVHWDLMVTMLLWVAAVLERLRGSGALSKLIGGDLDTGSTLRIIAFAMSSFLLLVLAACASFCCRAMSSAVDAFCANIVGNNALERAVPRWNVVQALLRKTSGTIQSCLLCLMMTVICMAILTVIDAYQEEHLVDGIASVVPGALLVLSVWKTFFKASEVSDKCARVPSLVNACTFSDEDIDVERQYVVDYVLHSAAGFYLFEIQVTSDLMLKFTYISGVVIIYVFTQIVYN